MWERHSRSTPPTGRQGNIAPSLKGCCDLQASFARNQTSPVAEVFGNSSLLVTGPKLLNLPNGATLSFIFKSLTPCATELLPLPSDNTILWHRQCTVILSATHSVLHGWRMAQQMTVEDQVIDVMRHT